jgi:hypothetical protein
VSDEQGARIIRDMQNRLDQLESLSKLNYDKGAWTPTYSGGLTVGVTTYSLQTGHYVRLGRVIIAKGRVTWTAATGTGAALISLPFTTSNSAAATPVTIWTDSVTFGALTPYGLAPAAVAYFRLWTPANNAASAVVAVEAAGDIIFQTTYFVD